MFIKFKEEIKDKIFFTSDPHFFHTNIIEYCNRPFNSVDEMNQILIENWNKVVPKDGIVFCGGDFAWTGNIGSIRNLVDRLNGKIYLTLGNHDIQNRLARPIFKEIFEEVEDLYYIVIGDSELEQKYMSILLAHYPFLYWRSGYIHIHGHVHSGPNSTSKEKVPFHPMRYDIGVDNNNFIPISYHQLKVIITKNILNN